MKDFRGLKVWEKAHALTLAIYKATEAFPKQEMYSLTSQIRRAVVSIPTNIAEGCGKSGDSDFGRYLQIAMGSASELEYLLLLSHDLCYLADSDYQRIINDVVEVRKMLNALIQRVKLNSSKSFNKS